MINYVRVFKLSCVNFNFFYICLQKVLGRDEVYQLFSTFYEASMIPRKIGDKPIQFEVTIGMLFYLLYYLYYSDCYF